MPSASSLRVIRGGRESDRPPARRAFSFDLRCFRCGYGIAVRMAPDRCPMCSGTVWEHARRPLLRPV